MSDKDPESWHLSKTVNVSHIFTTIVLVVGMISYIGEIEKSVAIQEIEISNIKETITENRNAYDNMFQRIDKKLDKLFDELLKQKQSKN